MTRADTRATTPPTAEHHAQGRRRRGHPIRGLRLRELLVLILVEQAGPMTVAQLVAAVDARNFSIEGRPGKVVSDQLRYELARSRVRRVGRGLYVAGTVTRQARWRMQRRISTLRRAQLRAEDLRNTLVTASGRGDAHLI